MDDEQAYETREVPGSALEFRISGFELGDNGDGAKTAPIRLLARAGQPIEHPYWGSIVHDFQGMQHKNRIPIDYRHDEPIGYVNKFDFTSGDLVLAGALVPFKESDKATEIIHKSKAGVPYEASIDFRAPVVMEELADGKLAEVNGNQVLGPATIVREWTLRGVAVCPYGADAGTSTQLSNAELFSISVKPKEKAMSDAIENVVEAVEAVETVTESVEATAAIPAATETLSEGRKFLSAFGQQGAVWYVEGKGFDECVTLFATAQTEKITQLETQISELQKRLAAAAGSGEQSPVSFDRGEQSQAKGFASKLKMAGNEDK